MTEKTVTPAQLSLRLLIYYLVLIGSIVTLANVYPDSLKHLPFGGVDALDDTAAADVVDMIRGESPAGRGLQDIADSQQDAASAILRVTLFAFGHLAGTVLTMLPITWTYKAVKSDSGFSKIFVRGLIILPICATTTVLLIQDSLALAFGLAALVAAVRFRVALDDTMDGIFIFAAVCVGLAAGIGYLGIALLMSVFFCFANVVLWAIDYGSNPIDELRQKRKHDKLHSPPEQP